MDRWLRGLWPLQDKEGEGAGGGGAGGDPPKGSPPSKDPPKGGDPKPPAAISEDVLPEELRGRPQSEVKFLLGHMVTALGERNKEVDDLKTQLAELRGEVRSKPQDPPKPDPYEGKSLEELILENTEEALDRWAEKRGYTKVVGDLSNEVGEVVFTTLATQLDDFEEHEEAIRAILKRGGLRATKQNVMGAYTMALGQKELANRVRGDRRGAGGIPPTPQGDPPPPKDEPALSTLELEIMKAHGVTDPKEWVKYRDNPPELKLRTS